MRQRLRKDAVVQVRLSADELARVKVVVAFDNRSVSAWVRYLARVALDRDVPERRKREEVTKTRQ